MPTFASRVLSFALFVLINAPNITARGSKGGGGSSISESFSSLNLGSVDTATFSFYLIFCLLTLFQTLKALAILGKRRPGEDYPRRKPFIILMILGILTLVAMYSLGAVIQSQANGITLMSLNLDTALSMLTFTGTLIHVFFYAGLLVLLDYRSTIQALQYGHRRSKQFVIVLRWVGGLFLLLMFICIIAGVIIRSTKNLTYYLGDPEPSATRAYDALYHLFIASYLVTTTVICGTSIILWTNRRSPESQYDWAMYDEHVSPILFFIFPALLYFIFFDMYHLD
jgi:hypothetical protein